MSLSPPAKKRRTEDEAVITKQDFDPEAKEQNQQLQSTKRKHTESDNECQENTTLNTINGNQSEATLNPETISIESSTDLEDHKVPALSEAISSRHLNESEKNVLETTKENQRPLKKEESKGKVKKTKNASSQGSLTNFLVKKPTPVDNVSLLKECPYAELEIETLDPSWLAVLRQELKKPYFKQLKEFLAKESSAKKTIYPPECEIYSWSRFCPFDKVRVVILGQDPYHGPNQAHGLSFSVRKGVSVPMSLKNIYKELESDISDFQTPKHGDLSSWSKQGVLMLNASLTVRAGEPASHSKSGWQLFTDAAIQAVNSKCTGVVFILWGQHAQKKGEKINQNNHFVIKSAHPSPFSATKFFGSRPFSKTNEYLTKKGKEPINWNSLISS